MSAKHMPGRCGKRSSFVCTLPSGHKGAHGREYRRVKTKADANAFAASVAAACHAVGQFRGRHENGETVIYSLCGECLKTTGDFFSKARRIGDGSHCDRCGKTGAEISR